MQSVLGCGFQQDSCPSLPWPFPCWRNNAAPELSYAYRTFPLIKLRPNFVYSFSPTMAHLIMVCRGRALGIKVKGLRHADL